MPAKMSAGTAAKSSANVSWRDARGLCSIAVESAGHECGCVQIVFCETMFKSSRTALRVCLTPWGSVRSGSAVKVEQLLVLATRRQKALLISLGNVVVVPTLVGH